ncbi:MAG: hypothetical protein VKO64_07105 [Candidatus Sericytochromatia bacterium]|nr:hypothetical protein [Candidatus Sericytochromatia bacterium]
MLLDTGATVGEGPLAPGLAGVLVAVGVAFDPGIGVTLVAGDAVGWVPLLPPFVLLSGLPGVGVAVGAGLRSVMPPLTVSWPAGLGVGLLVAVVVGLRVATAPVVGEVVAPVHPGTWTANMSPPTAKLNASLDEVTAVAFGIQLRVAVCTMFR